MSRAEEFIKEHIKRCSNLAHFGDINGNIWEGDTPWLTPDDARRAVEIAREEMIEWLRKNHEEYQYKAPYNYFDIEQCINDLKKAMEDKV